VVGVVVVLVAIVAFVKHKVVNMRLKLTRLRYGCIGLLKAFAFPVLVAISACPAGSQTPSFLPPPWQEQAFPTAFAVRGRASFPQVSYGYALSHARTIVPGRTDAVYLTSLRTLTTKVLPFQMSEASAIRLESASMNVVGHILLAGSYTQSSGGAERLAKFAEFPRDDHDLKNPIRNFVADLDSAGQLVALFDMGTYTPEGICAMPDGTFWTIGQDWSKEELPPKGQPNQQYALLRHFSGNGAMIGSNLPRSLTAIGPFGARNYHSGTKSSSQARIACGDNSVAAYVSRWPDGFVWIEVDAKTGVADPAVLMRNPVGTIISGLALTSRHIAFASFGTLSEDGVLRPGHASNLYRLVKTKQSGEWEVVQRGDETTTFGNLLGRDGLSLVHLQGQETPVSNPTVYWTKP